MPTKPPTRSVRGRAIRAFQGRLDAHAVAATAFVVTLLLALYLEFIIWPTRNQPVVYTIPMLVAALRFSPRTVRATVVAVIVLDLVDAYRARTSPEFWPYTLLALVVTGVLAVTLALERERTVRYARQAEDARARLQRFLAMVSHDLGSPTFAIVGMVQLLLDSRSGDTADEARALRTIANAARRVQRLMGDLRDAASIGMDHFEIHVASLDLVALAAQVVERQQSSTTRHRVRLEAPPRLEGCWDAERLGQLLDNLVSNAIKYSEGGDVVVRLEQRGQQVAISVSDQGTGIPAEELPLLFEPFTRLVSARRKTKGSGLGLYIARAIVEAHGGQIAVESAPQQGSVFRATLPMKGVSDVVSPVREMSAPPTDQPTLGRFA